MLLFRLFFLAIIICVLGWVQIHWYGTCLPLFVEYILLDLKCGEDFF